MIATLVDGLQEPGDHLVSLTAKDLEGMSNGIYFYRLEAGAYSETKRMVLVK